MRLFHRIYAFLFGFFWLPCPLCGEHFGGHEWTAYDATLWETQSSGIGVCKNCIPEAQRRNAERGFPYFFAKPWRPRAGNG